MLKDITLKGIRLKRAMLCLSMMAIFPISVMGGG